MLDYTGYGYSWDHRANAWLPPLEDNFYAMRFDNLGGLNPALLI